MASQHSQDKVFSPSFGPACHLALINLASACTLLSRSPEPFWTLHNLSLLCAFVNISLPWIPFSSCPHGKLFLEASGKLSPPPWRPPSLTPSSRIKISSAHPQHLVMPSPTALNILLSEPPLSAGDWKVFHCLLLFIRQTALKQFYVWIYFHFYLLFT